MPWTRKLLSPIELKDGRVIATLSDAARLMVTLPQLHADSPHWLHAGELLLEAAGDKESVSDAEAQLKIALKAEGLI
jgi:hypothetical protein